MRPLKQFGAAAVSALLAIGLLATSADAAPKTMSWKDAADDATVVGSYAAPLSNGALDILTSTIRAEGANVTWTLTFKNLGATAVGGTGVWYAFEFGYGDGNYTLRVNQDQVGGNTFQMQEESGQNQVSGVSCPRCNAKVDKAKNTVTITTPFASLANGVRGGAGRDPGPLQPGKTITAVSAGAGYMWALPEPVGPVLWMGATDSSVSPEPSEFTF